MKDHTLQFILVKPNDITRRINWESLEIYIKILIIDILVEKKISYKLSNQEPIEKIVVNFILTQINDVLVNLVRSVYFLIKICHKSRIIF